VPGVGHDIEEGFLFRGCNGYEGERPTMDAVFQL